MRLCECTVCIFVHVNNPRIFGFRLENRPKLHHLLSYRPTLFSGGEEACFVFNREKKNEKQHGKPPTLVLSFCPLRPACHDDVRCVCV